MNKRLSAETLQEILELLPAIREEVRKEFELSGEYNAGHEFYSDDMFIDILPYAAYEYIILAWGVKPIRVDIESVYYAMNNRRFKDLKKIMAHGLRRLASIKTA
jgi:hypothetical protein